MWVWFLMGRSPGGDQGNPLQYSCLKNPYEQRSLDRSNLGCGKGRSVFSGQERWLTWFVLLLVLRTIRFMSAEPWCLLLTSIFLEHVNSQTVFFPHIQSSYKKYYWIIDKTKTKPMPFLLLWEGKKKKRNKQNCWEFLFSKPTVFSAGKILEKNLRDKWAIQARLPHSLEGRKRIVFL